MPQGTPSQSGTETSGRQAPVQFAMLALKSIGQVYDMNVSAARVLLQTQARAASAVGWPDWSGLFNTVDERTRHVFSAGAEQFVDTAQRANDAAAELQREVGRVVETQTTTFAQTLQQGLQELGSQASEGLHHLVETARQQGSAAERTASSMEQAMQPDSGRAEDDGWHHAPMSSDTAGDNNEQRQAPPGANETASGNSRQQRAHRRNRVAA